MTEDISKKTLFILIILTMVISSIGSFVVLQELDALEMENSMQKPPIQYQQEQLSKTNAQTLSSNNIPAPAQPVTGKVTLTVVNPNK